VANRLERDRIASIAERGVSSALRTMLNHRDRILWIYGSGDPGDHMGTTRHARVCADLHSPHVNRRSASFHNVRGVRDRLTRRPGGQGVAGSNPVSPTEHNRKSEGRSGSTDWPLCVLGTTAVKCGSP
jgi:hypothetical protein